MDIERADAHRLRETRRTAADASPYFHPSYVQTAEGAPVDHDKFIRHVGHRRSTVRSGRMVVHEVVAEGLGIADPHTVKIT